nr:hypothetical protein [Tanacetum cinerariifolium]
MQKKKNDVKARTTLLLSLPDEHQNDLDSMSLDDLYNHLKVYKAEVQKKSNLNSQDMAFISSSKNSSNKDDNTVCVTTASTTFPSGSVNVATINQDTASAFIASQSNDKFWKRTRKKISIQGSDVAGFVKSKVECFNCHKMGHFERERRAPRSQERGRKESYRQGSKAEEKSSKALMAIDGMGWDWSYMANEEDHALVADEETHTEFALMANIENKVFDNSLCSNDCKKNTDSLNSKINDLKNQLSEENNYWYHYKLGVAQLEERLNEYKEKEENYIVKIRTLEMYRESNLDSIKILTNEVETLKKEKDVVDGKYNAVPPSAVDLYLSPKKDLSWTSLPEFVDDTVTDYSRPSPTVVSTSAEDQNKDTSTSEDVASPNPPKPFVKFVKPKDRVNLVSITSGSMSPDNTKNNRIRQIQKNAKKNKVEDHLRTVKSSLNKASVVDSKATSSVLNSVSNMNSDLKCASSNGCLLSDNHDTCVGAYKNSVNASKKSKSVKTPVIRKIWKTTGKVFKTVGHIWKPTGRTFTLVGNVCHLTRIATPTIVPPREPIPIVNSIKKPVVTLVVQIILWYLDSDCSKHMTENRSQLVNFVQKFLGTVKSRNDHVAKIMGYGDYQIGNVTISRVYYVEGLGHNLFSVGQFCDSDLEVAFRQHTCFIRNLDGVDLLTGSWGNNLYSLSRHIRKTKSLDASYR